jgi:hypothetical protein
MHSTSRDGVIPNARVFTSGRRDLAWTKPWTKHYDAGRSFAPPGRTAALRACPERVEGITPTRRPQSLIPVLK